MWITAYAIAHPLWFGLLCNVLGGLIVAPIPYLTSQIRESRGEFTGNWMDEILDDDGHVIKRDEIVMKQRGREIRGTIHRVFPPDQEYRRYRFRGFVRGESIIAIFWSTQESVRSFGSWHVQHTGDFIYDGFYLSLSGRVIEKIPIRVSKRTAS